MLEGKIPVDMGSLLKLTHLYLNTNNLIGGIPHSFGNLTSLEILGLALNNLGGSIPVSLGQLTRLTFLSLEINNLSGMIPSSIYNLSSLTSLGLSFNQLGGSLQPDLGFTLPNLQFFSVAANQLTGPIPASLSNATKVVTLVFTGNGFTGKIFENWGSLHNLVKLTFGSNHFGSREDGDLSFLTSLSNCTRLKFLGLDNNSFGGVLPDSIGNLSSQIAYIALGRNEFTGSVPQGIGNLIGLSTLGMESNLLTGTIPTSIGNLQNLQLLYLNGNRLSGRIPSTMGNLTQLAKLQLLQNNLSDIIPPTLGNCKRLIHLDLSQNSLSGTIPQEIYGLSSLAITLNFAQNKLTGPLLPQVSNLNLLAQLIISDNKLSGEIPTSLGSCISLISLDMSGNFFHGTIPPSLSSLTALEYFDLSSNILSGLTPEFLGTFTFLHYLNISFNNLEGKVPMEGVFKNVSEISISGNSKLCGGISELQLPSCLLIKEPSKKRWISFTIKFIVIGSSIGLICFIFVLLGLYLYRRKKRRNELRSISSTSGKVLLKISYQELQKATNGFSSANFIGAGGFGSVFKGILDQDGSLIAVKVLNLQHRGASKSFMAECEALRNIRHRNLVKVITSCSTIDFQGNDFKAIVYEFMSNGSLEQHLYPNSEALMEMKNLNFLQRLNIVIDIAAALDYLHHHCQTPVIHCDLKPSNVLLDNNMIAYVSDFGLARFVGESSHKPSQNEMSSVGIKGSIGYVAPEYAMGSKVTIQGDVYSYGILLLETFIGKRPTNDMFKDGLNLHNVAKMALPEQVMQIIDPVLIFVLEEEENVTSNETGSLRNSGREKLREGLISVIRIGVSCSMEFPRDRMNMSEVHKELHLIRDIFMRI